MRKAFSFKNIGIYMTALACAVSGAILSIPPTKARAAGCSAYTTTTSGATSTYRYTSQKIVPNDALCTSIWVVTWVGNCQYLRVRFYPSSGGSWANAWKYSCSDTIQTQIATNVIDGTRYRIESQKMTVSTFDVGH